MGPAAFKFAQDKYIELTQKLTASSKGIAHLDTNALIRALEKGEVSAVDKALSGRVPVISEMTLNEYLVKGDAKALYNFLSDRGGYVTKTKVTAQEVQQLINLAKSLGRSLKPKDAEVVLNVMKENAPIITRDARLIKFLNEIGAKVEDY